MPFGQTISYSAAESWITDAERALQHVEYMFCVTLTLPDPSLFRAEYTKMSEDELNPSSCARLCTARSNGRDHSVYMLGPKTFSDEQVRCCDCCSCSSCLPMSPMIKLLVYSFVHCTFIDYAQPTSCCCSRLGGPRMLLLVCL